jgi:hypothetical protein
MTGDKDGDYEPQGLIPGTRRRKRWTGTRRSMPAGSLINTIVRGFGGQIGRVLGRLLMGLFRR